jgi:hypothetical protein
VLDVAGMWMEFGDSMNRESDAFHVPKGEISIINNVVVEKSSLNFSKNNWISDDDNFGDRGRTFRPVSMREICFGSGRGSRGMDQGDAGIRIAGSVPGRSQGCG